MSIAAGPLVASEAESAGLFSRTANFMSGASSVAHHNPLPMPSRSPIASTASLTQNTVKPGAVVA